MRKFLIQGQLLLTALFIVLFSTAASGQTLSLSDGSIVQSSTNRVGLNIGSINFYDNGQILKNLIGSLNPGFEPLSDRQIWSLTAAGTATSFTVPDIYDMVPANYWKGATFSVVASQSNGAELGCTGTIASNTGPNSPYISGAAYVAPVITTSSACSAAFNVGDIIVISESMYPTPNSWYLLNGGQDGGFWAGASNGGAFETDTTDLCPTCGKQSLDIDASASGSQATASWYFDGTNANTFVLVNGTYQLSFWAKAASGNPVVNVFASRLSTGGFSCPTVTPKLTTTWTQYTYSCNASETAGVTQLGTAKVAIQVSGGSMYLDNVSFAKTSPSTNNPTVLRDEVIETMQNYFANDTPGPSGLLRYWLSQNGETLDNWTSPDYAHGPSIGGTGYMNGPGGKGRMVLSLEDYLVICQFLNVDPYLEVPVTFSNSEAANLIEFLGSPSSTTYGARRAALGQVEPWTSVFDKIHLSFCNECWNSYTFNGEALAWRSTASNGYYDYGVRTGAVFNAMHQDEYYNASSFDLVMNAQTAINFGMDAAIQTAAPDSIEIENYTYPTVNVFDNDADLWGPAMVEPYMKTIGPDPKNFYQSITDYQSQKTCGASHNATCKVNIYEWGQGTTQGTIDQTHMDYINAAAGEGVIMALQPLINMQKFGIMPQTFFSLTEFQNSSLTANTAKLWGNVVDMGGATNNLRPAFLGISLVNQSIIGPMYSCPINNNATYNSPASTNGYNSATPAISNVPYMYAFCFENGTKRSMVLVNIDLTNSHTLTFSGTNVPAGSVTQRQYAPKNLDDMNEAHFGVSNIGVQATSALTTSSLSSPTSITLPPHSVTALDYTAAALPIASTPVFSPAAGSYTTGQVVTISDANSGTTVYYTTDGSTPTNSSTQYTGPISVNSNETFKAIAIENNFTSSSVASAAYAIAPLLPTPTFSVAAGIFTSVQSVSIADATSGATIYYTTNGTTPTTSSAQYTGPISVGVNETLQAIAVEAGFTTSAVGSASYVIAPLLPQPVFSVAPGTYSSAQTVTISELIPGATIYYCLNHTPTTASPVYTGPITINSSETLEAIAVLGGFTSSQVVTGAYTISGSTSYINYPNGAFNASSFNVNNGASVTSAGLLQITDGGSAENRTAWYSTKVPVQNFVTDFTFHQLNASGDGMTFTIQGQGLTALGTAGGGLGYQNIPNSVAVKFDLYSNAGEGSDSTGLYTNGAAPTVPSVNLTSTAINLHSSDLMDAHMFYDGTNLTMTLTDTVTGGVVTEVFPVNIPSIIGANTAYVGFTGGTGGSSATQQIVSWTYASNSSQPATTTAATPTFSVAGGSYTSAQTVTIADGTSGATIYYTTNGTAPTASSTKYTGAITVSSTETLNAIAVASSYNNSAVASATYTIGSTLPAPTFNVPAGSYATSQTVTISDATAGTTIYYTTNGTTPTTSSTAYTGSITVANSETLEAIAVKTGSANSPVASAAYAINPILPLPIFSVSGGVYTTSQNVAISTQAVAQATGAVKAQAAVTVVPTVYYTVDGSTPTTSSKVYTGSIMVQATETLRAIAVATGYTNSPVASAVYTIAPVLPVPTFSVAAGSYAAAQSVTIGETTPGTTIYYTTNGATPGTSSNVYSGAITVSSTETLEAIAVESGYTNSPVATAAYVVTSASVNYINIASGKFAASSFALNGGATVTSGGLLQVTDGGQNEGRSAWFTTAVPVKAFTTDFTFQQLKATGDGLTFTIQGKGTTALGSAGGALGYAGIGNSVAVKFDLYSNSGEGTDSTGLYSGGAQPTMPAVDLTSSGIVLRSGDVMHAHMVYDGTNLTMTLTDTVTNATVTLTIAVNIPSLVGGNTAYVGFTGGTGGSTATQNVLTWTYTSTPATTTGAALSAPAFSPAGGTYSSSQSVKISDATAGATIYYTTNGTTPTTSSTKYTGPITVAASQKLEAIAVSSSAGSSPVGTASYTIQTTLPAPTFSVAAGTYSAGQSVTIGDAVAGATIYYTTNGTTPTTASTKYAGAVNIGSSQTLLAIAVASGYVNSSVTGAVYIINAPLPKPSFSIAGSTYSTAQTVSITDTGAGVTIYYTTNGTTPTTASAKYTGPIKVSASEELQAIAARTGYITSPVTAAMYYIAPILPTPVFSLAAGKYSAAQKVTISDAAAAATIYYTTNGTAPTAASTKYTGAITVSATETLLAKAIETGYTQSAPASATYSITK